MTNAISSHFTCAACGESIPVTVGGGLYTNTRAPAIPDLHTHQWRSRGRVLDFCDGCAEKVRVAVAEVFADRRA